MCIPFFSYAGDVHGGRFIRQCEESALGYRAARADRGVHLEPPRFPAGGAYYPGLHGQSSRRPPRGKEQAACHQQADTRRVYPQQRRGGGLNCTPAKQKASSGSHGPPLRPQKQTAAGKMDVLRQPWSQGIAGAYWRRPKPLLQPRGTTSAAGSWIIEWAVTHLRKPRKGEAGRHCRARQAEICAQNLCPSRPCGPGSLAHEKYRHS